MEFRLALRDILRRPALSAAVVMAIALAVAINGALFSVLDGLLFRPLPLQDPDRLVAIGYRSLDGSLPKLAWLPELAERRDNLRERLEHSPHLAAASQAGFVPHFRPDEARDLGLEVTGVDSRFFRLLGLTPLLGVDFSLEDERSAAALSPDGTRSFQSSSATSCGGVSTEGIRRFLASGSWRVNACELLV